MNIAIVGAQGTGKSALARALQNADRPDGMPDGFNATEAHALQQAVSHDLLFQDPSHYPQSLEHHRNYGLTLVMGLDLPFASPPVHTLEDLPPARFDARLRQVLNRHGIQFTVVYGRGQDRTDCALQAIAHHTRRTQSVATSQNAARWSHGLAMELRNLLRRSMRASDVQCPAEKAFSADLARPAPAALAQ
jgi:ABC-type dipeptide/oligopeptide/nickel transport system ATPase subunit